MLPCKYAGAVVCISVQAITRGSSAHPARGPSQQHPSKMAANSSSTGSKSSNSAGGKQSGPSAEQVSSPLPRPDLVCTVNVAVVRPCQVKLKPLIRLPASQS